MNQKISFSLPDTVLEAIDAAAAERKESRSCYLRRVCADSVNGHYGPKLAQLGQNGDTRTAYISSNDDACADNDHELIERLDALDTQLHAIEIELGALIAQDQTLGNTVDCHGITAKDLAVALEKHAADIIYKIDKKIDKKFAALAQTTVTNTNPASACSNTTKPASNHASTRGNTAKPSSNPHREAAHKCSARSTKADNRVSRHNMDEDEIAAAQKRLRAEVWNSMR